MTEETCPSCRCPLPPDAPGGLCPVCVLRGAREDAVPPDLPPIEEIRAALPQFEILECIGRGGMGVVYKARQPQLDRLVALKILLPGLDHDPGFAERFSREARALAKLSHPNIVAVHDFGESGGYFWLTMEYVDGVNLRQAMQAARFTPAQALALIPELCAALQYAHDHGVLHRDIKPENILLDPKGRVKVADFGIARMAGDERMDFTLTRTGSVLGSAAYVAPEQIERPHEVDHRADLYSLGVVLYEMLTGELPLGRFPAPSEKSASDPRLDEVVFRTLEKEREKRFQSADELKSGVRDFDREPGATEAAQERASNEVAGGTSPEAAANPKTLVSAVVAAGFTGMGLLAGVPVMSELRNAREYEVLPPAAILAIVVGVVALLFTATGVILGILSIVKIRESGGKLRGAPAAWFAIGAPLLFALGSFVKFIVMALVVIGLPALAVRTFRRIRKRRGGRSPQPASNSGRLYWMAGFGVVILVAPLLWYQFGRGKEVSQFPGGPVLSTVEAAGETPQAAVEALLAAARDRDEESFLARMSGSFAAEVRRESDGSVFFGDFARVRYLRTGRVGETTAQVVVQPVDDPTREFGLTMVLEDGSWKLSTIGR